jgi:hypothetical protein
MLVYRLTVVDFNGTYQLFGFIFGDQIKQLDSVGKTITLGSDSNGNYTLTIGTFNNTSGVSINGTIRHI